MTPAVRLSLEILADRGPLSPSEFAHQYFPRDHDGWQRSCKCGAYGSHRGGGLVLWAGGWLGKLRAQGLVTAAYRQTGQLQGHVLTAAGRAALAPS